MLYIDIQTTKPFIVSEMTVKGHSRSSAMSSFVRTPRLNQRTEKYITLIFTEKLLK